MDALFYLLGRKRLKSSSASILEKMPQNLLRYPAFDEKLRDPAAEARKSAGKCGGRIGSQGESFFAKGCPSLRHGFSWPHRKQFPQALDTSGRL
jgi:hypothetical protein